MRVNFLFITLILFLIIPVSHCQNNNQALPYGLQLFTNMEQIPYCVPVPLKEYIQQSSVERAKYTFVNKKNKKYEMELQGMFRSDETVSIEDYFKNSYTEQDEEEGKIVENKELIKNKNCFYAEGYWSNSIYESKFIEITWLRKEDVVKLVIDYSIKDTTLWNNRLKTILQYDSSCN